MAYTGASMRQKAPEGGAGYSPLAMSAPRMFGAPLIHRGLPCPSYGEWGPGSLPLMPGCGLPYEPQWGPTKSFRWAPHRNQSVTGLLE